MMAVDTTVIAVLAVHVAPVAAGGGPCSVLWAGSHPVFWNDGSATVAQIWVEQFATPNLTAFDVIYVYTSAVASGGASIPLDRAADAFVGAGDGLITDDGGDWLFPNFSWVSNSGSLGWVTEGQPSVFLMPLGTTHSVTARKG